jgi:hypothetical protein
LWVCVCVHTQKNRRDGQGVLFSQKSFSWICLVPSFTDKAMVKGSFPLWGSNSWP